MSLATRCTSCGTIFRVVQDQLKVSEGWVRCGRCDAVFNAAEGLFDLEREAPPDWQPAVQEPVEAHPDSRERLDGASGTRGTHASNATDASDIAYGADHSARQYAEPISSREAFAEPPVPAAYRPGVDTHDDEFAPDEIIVAPGSPGTIEPAFFEPRTSERQELERPSSSRTAIDHAALARTSAASTSIASTSIASPPNASTSTASASTASISTEPPLPPVEPPGFVQRAQREASWQSRRSKVLLGAASLVLLIALVLQGAQHFGDLAAARWPVLRPALEAWCGVSGCAMGAPHRIDDVVVESTALAPTPGPNTLKLAINLRNRAAYAVAMPSVDLSLTDTAGQLIARRVLAPRDFQVSAPSLQAGAEIPLQVVLSAGSGRVSGYTVEIFYP